MAIPKRFEEIVEEQGDKVRIVANVGPMQYKTGGTFSGLLVEAMVGDERIGYFTAEKQASGNYIMDGVYVEPEYRNQGIATEMLRKAHATVNVIPYALTDNQVYQSEAGKGFVAKELRMVTASTIVTAGPLLAIPELLGAGEAVAGAGEAVAGAGEAAAGAAGTATVDAAATADAATADAATADAAAAGEPASNPSLWSRLKGFAKKPIFVNGRGNNSGLGSNIPPTIGPYGGTGGGGGPVQVKRMLSSKQANPAEMAIMQKIDQQDKLLTMILETLCRCGEPTAGMFNGMPHCMPGTGCATNISMSPTNPSGDACCSCGNPQCSGSFHGQPICAPGQGCNDHWEPGVGRKWNPIMESPEEKIADHDQWASETNHGQFEMPEHHQTTWQ